MFKNIKSQKKPIEVNYLIFLVLKTMKVFYYSKKEKKTFVYPSKMKIINGSHEKKLFHSRG